MGSVCCTSTNHHQKNSNKKKSDTNSNPPKTTATLININNNDNNLNQPSTNNPKIINVEESNRPNNATLTFPNHNSSNRPNNNDNSSFQSCLPNIFHNLSLPNNICQNEALACNDVSINDEQVYQSNSFYNNCREEMMGENNNSLNSSRTNHFCNRCNSNFATISQYNNHLSICLQSRHNNNNNNNNNSNSNNNNNNNSNSNNNNNSNSNSSINFNQNIHEMHDSLNQMLNLVHSLHTQMNTNNMLALLGYGECEESNEYFDWEYCYNNRSTLEINQACDINEGKWKNKGKIILNKKDLKNIEEKTIDMICKEKYYIKRIWLLKYINTKIYDKTNDNTPLVISRNNILEESFNQFMTTNELDLKRGMHIFFVDEIAQDVGGVYREWYDCLFKEIFSKEQNFFYSNINNGPGKNTYLIPHTQPMIYHNKYEQLAYYEFIGKVIAKALFDKITLNVNINMIIIKQLLKKPINLQDLVYYDKDIYQSLHSILIKKIGNDDDLPFTWNIRNENNELVDHELIPNGRNVYVNDFNKQRFIDKVVQLLTYDLVKMKVDALIKGFYSLIKGDIVSIFQPEELNFILSGQDIIDLDDWKKNTAYKGYYTEKHWVIKMFWEIMQEMKTEELAVFFKFCTGCSRVPIDGFSSLQATRNKFMKFTIESPSKQKDNDESEGISSMIKIKSKAKNAMRLIEAKTCFNRIILPEYESKEQMKKAIYIIINNDTNFFGLQ